MDELRGPNIQLVLHVREGLGFGFLKSPFIVSGSLNGYILETDPSVPCHAPCFDAELVWEADKRKFRNLRVQNVPIKIEVYSTGTQGRKDKIGYMMMSLLGAQPCPANKSVEPKYTWHRLLGLKSEAKCCHPQLLLSLTVEDRISVPTPRNEYKMFHSNEVAYLSTVPAAGLQPTISTMTMTVNEYIIESKRTASSHELQPKLISDEGLIQIGSGQQLFVLSFVLGTAENVDLLLQEKDLTSKDCYIKYSVFSHDIMTDRVALSKTEVGMCSQFHQRTSLRIRSSLSNLIEYLSQCSYLVVSLYAGDNRVGICSMDLRKLVPTEDEDNFVSMFCNDDQCYKIHERCYMLPCEPCEDSRRLDSRRRSYLDVEMCLKCLPKPVTAVDSRPKLLTARSALQLKSRRSDDELDDNPLLSCKVRSCTVLGQEADGVDAAYTNTYSTIPPNEDNRVSHQSGDGPRSACGEEIVDLIRKMCESFTVSQERCSVPEKARAEAGVQCDWQADDPLKSAATKVSSETQVDDTKPQETHESNSNENKNTEAKENNKNDKKLEAQDMVKIALTPLERDVIMQKFVDELEDWKEQQQELYKYSLKRKEEYHLELLSREWMKKRAELEIKLSRGVERCGKLADELARTTHELRQRGYTHSQRENKLIEAKNALERHYTSKFEELRDASLKMEHDMNQQVQLRQMKIDELQLKCQQLEKTVDSLKATIAQIEKEAENKYSGLTKDQTASLIQELRCLEEKLDSAVQSKAFFKEQWGRAVRELHLTKLHSRKQILTQLHNDRRQLGDDGSEPMDDPNDSFVNQIDLDKLKNNYYVDLLLNTPALEADSVIGSLQGPGGMGLYNELIKDAPKNPINEKLTKLIDQREKLIKEDEPDEDTLKQLNHDIRNMLLNYGT